MMKSLRNTRWVIADPAPAEHYSRFPNTDRLLIQTLFNRGIATPESVQSFLDKRSQYSTDPFLLNGMKAAVQRIRQAIQDKEFIAVYGDYDADGVTASVLLTQALRAMGAGRVEPYIPHRMDEGYGLNLEALDYLHDKGNQLVITVDCGVRAVEQVAYARDLGMDVIVTDHHGVGPELPPALAIIDYKQPSDQYPEKILAGVGLAFKLVEALVQEGEELKGLVLDDLLDLVALGTVADLALLVGENRDLVDRGLKVIQAARRPGLAALMQQAGVKPQSVDTTTIGFVLGPRINAAGRMEHAYAAARLLSTPSSTQATKLARELDELNQSRQEQTRQMTTLAQELACRQEGALLLFAAHEDFPSGIVGLIASRLQESFYRPAIVAQIRDDVVVGSCRSIPEFHITEALDQCQDLLEKHGGHAAAAGFTVRRENLPALQARLAELAQASLGAMELTPSLDVDMELDVRDIVWEVQETLAQLQPCGYGNPQPLLFSPDVVIENHYPVGRDGAHLKLFLLQDGRRFGGIAFRMGHFASELPDRVDVVYYLEVNEWNGRKDLQLNVQDMRPAR